MSTIQLSVPQLVEKVLSRNEGKLTSTGAVCVTTGKYTGRSPKDKFIVEEESTKDKIDWGPVISQFLKNLFENYMIK